MKKYIIVGTLVLAAFGSFTSSHANAQTTTPVCPTGYTCTTVPTASCPAGYVCTPVTVNCPTGYTCTSVPSLPNCPSGYICTYPTPGTTPVAHPTDVTAVVNGTPSLQLTYDSGHNEVQLTATIPFSVNSGNSGIYVYQRGANVNVSGFGNIGGSITPQNNLTLKTDDRGLSYYSVLPGQIQWFTVTASLDPRIMFAGTYTAYLNTISVNTTAFDANQYQLSVPKNLTNAVTIIGEKGPYITSVTNPLSIGQTATISGQRLSGKGGDNIYIDGNLVNSTSNSDSTITFVVPGLASGFHSLYVVDAVNGKSNGVGFQVQATSTTPTTDATISVNSDKLALTYDSNNKESQLTAGWSITVNGGSKGVNVLRKTFSFTVTNQQGYGGAYGTTNVDLSPTLPTGNFYDAYGQQYWNIPANNSLTFIATAKMNPRVMFAGTYTASLNNLVAYPGQNTSGALVNIPAPQNQTNPVTVVGEQSPYITSVTNPAIGGQTFSINGQRLMDTSNFGQVKIDGNPVTGVDGSKDGTLLFFKMPLLGNTDSKTLHSVNVTTSAGQSNIAVFQYQAPSSSNCYMFVNNLTIGSTGPDVTALQTLLIFLGYMNPVSVKGYFGSETAAAVEKFQAAYGLPATGFVGPLTRAALNSVSCKGGGPAGSAQANISLDPASPLASTVPVTDTTNGQYLGLPVLVFDIGAQNSNLQLNGVVVSLNTSGTGNVTAAYLYQGSTQVASASVSNGTASFQIMRTGTPGSTIPVNTTVPYTVKADVTGVSGNGLIVTASMPGGSQYIGLTSATAPATVSGSAKGNPITVIGAGPLFTLASAPSISSSVLATTNTQLVQYKATFNVNVQVVGGDVTLGLSNSTYPAFNLNSSFAVFKNGAPISWSSLTNGSGIAYSQPTNTTINSSGNAFTIARNQSVTIPVTVTFTVPSTNDVYQVQLNQIYWIMNGVQNVTSSMTNQVAWRTPAGSGGGGSSVPYVTINAIKNNQALSNNSTINIGDTISIQGAPYNTTGMSVSRAFFFDPIFNNSCTNNDSVAVYQLTCTAKNSGSSKFYIQIYVNGQTYTSNIITINVASQSTNSLTNTASYPTPTPATYVTPTPTPSPTYTISCPSGYSWSGSSCVSTYVASTPTPTPSVTPVTTCAAGYYWSGYMCIKTATSPSPTPTATPTATPTTSATPSPTATPTTASAQTSSQTASVWDAIWSAIGVYNSSH